jgi:hypothetical protein
MQIIGCVQLELYTNFGVNVQEELHLGVHERKKV